jgi:hypothetical protein
MKVRIRVGEEVFDGEIFDTPTGRAVAEILPVETPFQTWGDEFSFSVPMNPQPLEEPVGEGMMAGDIGYWPGENSLSIFLNPTPEKCGTQPFASAPVNRIGHISGQPARLRRAAGSPTLRIEPA